MNKTSYFVLLVLLVTFSIYSQTNSILVIHPNGSQYKKLIMGIKTDINSKMTIKSIASKNEAEIIGIIDASSPKMVVVMGLESIRVWKKIQQKNQIINQIPSIYIENEIFGKNIDIVSNSCIITYETKLEQYVERVTHLTGKKPQNIGVVFSSRSSGLLKSYQNESSRINVGLHAKQVVASDPENSIKTIVSNFVDHYNVDFMIIIEDHTVINNQNINTMWVSLLAPLRIPVAVPPDYFYELEPRIGSFAIQPHYSEIGHVIASVINETEANNWIIKQKSIYTDKSIFYYRNKDGSISRQNQLQNKNVAFFHPIVPQNIQKTPQNEVVVSDIKQNLAHNNLPQENEKVENISSQVSSELVIVKTDVEKEKPKPVIVAVTSKSTVNKKNSKPATKKDEPGNKKKETTEQRTVSKADKKSPQATVLNDNKNYKENVVPFTALKNDNYDIEVTTITTNIYKNLNSDFPVLGIAKSGDKLNVTSEDSVWYCVNFFGTPGFISKADAGKFIKKQSSDRISEFSAPNIIFIVSLILVSCLILILLKLKAGRGKLNKINCLLISNRKKSIKYSNINTNSISIVKYLKNYGFHIIMSKNLNHTRSFLYLNIPEIICVDWKFEKDIQDKVCEILKERMLTADFMLIFYNVESPASIKKEDCFDDRTFFFSKNFTISDLNKVLTKIKTTDKKSENNDKSKSVCLEGKITEEALTEIFQMMDINKKTGCLLVENHHPAGMIFFEDGIITYAISNSQVGEKAVFDILSMKHGRFQFLPDKKSTSKQMQLDIVAVLMERAKLVDEIDSSLELGLLD